MYIHVTYFYTDVHEEMFAYYLRCINFLRTTLFKISLFSQQKSELARVQMVKIFTIGFSLVQNSIIITVHLVYERRHHHLLKIIKFV